MTQSLKRLFGLIFCGLSLLGAAEPALAKIVRYELSISRGSVNLSGKQAVDWALKVNGGIPAPTLEFTEGDDAEITVTNQLESEETSIHWHGILLPPEQDGVAYVDRKSTRLNSSHIPLSRMPSSA